MRVIAGHLRGRRLQAPAGRTTRPITDRAKETLFDMLAHRLASPPVLPRADESDPAPGGGGWEAVRVLDLFAGSGSLGIEALSRGALHCTFVEHDRTALQALRGNLRALGLEARSAVLTSNAWAGPIRTPDQGFGLVFLDPPYRDSRDVQRIADLLNRVAAVLRPAGLAVLRLETRATLPQPEAVPDLTPAGDRAVGSTRLVYLEKST